MCWFGHAQRMEGNRIVCVGLDMYREWEKTELYVLVWTCTENGRKQNCVCWFGHVQKMEKNRIPQKVFCMNLGTTRLRGRPRNRWQNEVREDGRLVGGKWMEGKGI